MNIIIFDILIKNSKEYKNLNKNKIIFYNF